MLPVLLAASPQAAPILRPQQVRPLPGSLDAVLMLNDNNPELISGPGILLSTFADPRHSDAHLDLPLNGRFDLFSHHVYAGTPEQPDSTIWLAVVAQPRGEQAVELSLLSGSTALSQSTDGREPQAPFLPLPERMRQDGSTYAGPGSRVATELLLRQRNPNLPKRWTLRPGSPTTLLLLPIPVQGLDPLLNGRNLQLRLQASGAISVATLAAFGNGNEPPTQEALAQILSSGVLSPKEHKPTPRGARGRMVYSRVSGVQIGSTWSATVSDPGKSCLSTASAPISWPIASLERGRLGTGQVQTAELKAHYPGTAWAAHGNYGVAYDIRIPLCNRSKSPAALAVALESPLKTDQAVGGLQFNSSPSRSVMFRGTVELNGLDGQPSRQSFHLVQRAGQQGPELGRISLTPGETRELRVRLIYPADATPPQVLSLLPVKQSPAPPDSLQP